MLDREARKADSDGLVALGLEQAAKRAQLEAEQRRMPRGAAA